MANLIKADSVYSSGTKDDAVRERMTFSARSTSFVSAAKLDR